MLEHGGRLRRAAQRYGIAPAEWLDLSTGINPHGWPVPPVDRAAWTRLPEEEDGLLDIAAAYYGAPRVVAGAGTQAIIQALPRVCARSRVGVIAPGYNEHAHAWTRAGHDVRHLSADALPANADALDVAVLIHPNNPGGERFERGALLDLHERLAVRGGWLVIDEAFMDATPGHSVIDATAREGLVVLRSPGKFFGLAGARVGFVATAGALLDRLRDELGPWPVAGPSRAIVAAALEDRAWQSAMRAKLAEASARLRELLIRHGLAPHGGCALFQWVKVANAAVLHEALARKAILTRLFEEPASLRFGLPADESAWQRLERALAPSPPSSLGGEGWGEGATLGAASSSTKPLASPPHPALSPNAVGGEGSSVGARVLMVQGTTSDAGKSALVTGLCRWLHRRGVAVAPFKPQNMALNSAVTADGGEIGRAQAVQAQAAGLAPHTDFNPILLKPNTDMGAQVIVHGRAIGSMQAQAYHDYKRVAREAVLASHARLAARYDAVVVEGAGSPAEINLRANDIANMGYAEAVDCPVILIADIDRGGVFAHLVGTLALLSPSERARVAGFVINRFRGDIALLQPGLDWLERETGKPVLGVLPYLMGLHVDAEDALPRERAPSRGFRVIAPALPRISNHTDFDALRHHPQVSFSFIGPGEAPPPADLVVLPGSKSVRADLGWLRANGWEPALQRHLRYGGKVIGICGGLQMLGTRLRDPLGIEGPAGDSDGLGLLDLETTLEPVKQLRNVHGRLHGSDAAVAGYEIHCGVSRGTALARPALQLDGERPDGARPDGAMSEDGRILATYVHGVFDTPEACDALLAWAGLDGGGAVDLFALREAGIERLADAVEQHLDIARLDALFGLTGAPSCAR